MANSLKLIMGERITIRPARPQDASAAAPLIYSTGPQSFDLAFGSRNRSISIIKRLFTRPGNPLSFDYTTVAELKGRVVGILTVGDRKAELKTQSRMGAELLKICGPMPLLARLPIHLRLQRLTRLAGDEELCIEDIAVEPQVRGYGIGRVLMLEAERLAKSQRKSLISLYVLADNTRAIDFYQHLGYRIDELRFDPWLKRRFGFPGFLRMAKT